MARPRIPKTAALTETNARYERGNEDEEAAVELVVEAVVASERMVTVKA
jgi:hypothetical protein